MRNTAFETLAGLPYFAAFFGVSLLLLTVCLALYVLITPYPEIKLIREGNAAAAASLGGVDHRFRAAAGERRRQQRVAARHAAVVGGRFGRSTGGVRRRAADGAEYCSPRARGAGLEWHSCGSGGHCTRIAQCCVDDVLGIWHMVRSREGHV